MNVNGEIHCYQDRMGEDKGDRLGEIAWNTVQENRDKIKYWDNSEFDKQMVAVDYVQKKGMSVLSACLSLVYAEMVIQVDVSESIIDFLFECCIKNTCVRDILFNEQ